MRLDSGKQSGDFLAPIDLVFVVIVVIDVAVVVVVVVVGGNGDGGGGGGGDGDDDDDGDVEESSEQLLAYSDDWPSVVFRSPITLNCRCWHSFFVVPAN
ncbi:unnamed protein product [Enterobius vermicularis]|uniref:Uncharacterized protein n=1 Tax=Enterobius vermicularis TaxID=51028 RepID=A0A0N4VNJ7_ENTVE|nr:unnamed protein product [Enterobius vermicularis]